MFLFLGIDVTPEVKAGIDTVLQRQAAEQREKEAGAGPPSFKAGHRERLPAGGPAAGEGEDLSFTIADWPQDAIDACSPMLRHGYI